MKFIGLLIILLFSCSEQEGNLIGKWKYENPQGAYSEVWFNKNQIVLVDEEFYSVTLADYTIKGDTIWIYYGEELQNKLIYSMKSENEFVIGQNQDISVTRFDSEISDNLDYSDSTILSIRQEFADRVK